MHHLYGKGNAVTIQFSFLKCSDAGDILNGSQFSQQKLDERKKCISREFKKSLQLHITLRICRSEMTEPVLYNSRFSTTTNCSHKTFNFFSLFLIKFSLFIDNIISIWVPFTK